MGPLFWRNIVEESLVLGLLSGVIVILTTVKLYIVDIPLVFQHVYDIKLSEIAEFHVEPYDVSM